MDTDSRWSLKLLAAFMTLTAMGMAAVAAWDRGGTAVDRSLLVSMAVTICAGTHLLPALSRRRVAWLIWSACLLGTIYGHLTFFSHTALRAGTVRAQQAAPVTDITRQIDATQAALAGISAPAGGNGGARLGLHQERAAPGGAPGGIDRGEASGTPSG
jgi:hypothetical protein